jgi:SAM-dependent methyltransferase
MGTEAGDATALNRAHWDDLAAVHGEGDDVYDVAALAAGEYDLREAERAALELATGGDVAGLEVLHVQCHIGFDSVALARRGARVVGADFSPASLAKARAIADRCGVEVAFVEADSRALPSSLHGRFDLVYATYGVFNWIDDVAAWMRSAFAALRPGGRLVVVEIHPLCMGANSADPFVLDFPYADDGPRTFDDPGSYADRDAQVGATTTIEHAHSVGEVVTAALGAGFTVLGLAEGLDAEHDVRGGFLPREDDGRYRMRHCGIALPILYSLVASRT